MRSAARYAFVVFAGLFLLGVTIQVFLAGMVVVAGEMNWESHIGLGHSLGIALIIMLAAMYAGRFDNKIKLWTWVLFVVYLLQADVLIFLRSSVPLASALHPVLALFDFSIGWFLLLRSYSCLRESARRVGNSADIAESARSNLAAGSG